MVLYYDKLVNDYVENLHTNLRNFKQGPDFLDTWVHDEDHTKSIFGVFESAAEAKLNDLTLVVSSSIAKGLNVPCIETETKKIGKLTIVSGGSETTLSMEFFASKGSFQILEIYKKAIKEASLNVCHEKTLSTPAGAQSVHSVTLHGITLSCLVNSAHEILDVSHQGATELNRVLLDVLCGLIMGRSIQEASDHGVLRLEFKLRDKSALIGTPVKGIITCDNTDPAFRVPQDLIRTLYKKYLENTNVSFGRNFWDERPSAHWLSLSTEEKIARVEGCLSAALKEYGLQEVGTVVVGIKDDVRVVLSVVQDPHRPSVGNYLIKLERVLKERLESRLEIQLESLSDRNKRKERTTKIFKH